ncbi:hypothetical protein SCB49_02224 [unidentified eubacterium SCB49]|nr:hypothetical protein SCB49_02224 [unidentified eubacterium SCB49]
MSFSFLNAQNSLVDLSNDEKQNILQVNPSFNTLDGQQLLQQVGDVNQVYIQQMGYNNTAVTQVVSSRANVEIYQIGDDNSVFSYYNAGTINSEIVQQGNANTFFETALGGAFEEVNSINSQIGDNLTLTKIGSNSISNNISINMAGNNKTISVISF